MKCLKLTDRTWSNERSITAKEYRLINLVDTKLLAVKIKEPAMALATRN
jgi:hypothetical protein